MPSCCTCAAARGEFQGPMFDLVEHSATPSSFKTTKSIKDTINDNTTNKNNIQRHLDIERTFSPGPRPFYLTAKLFLLAWIIAITVQSIRQKTHKIFWLAYLTHWGVVLTVAYMFMSVVSAIYLTVRPPANSSSALEGGVGVLLKTTWALFAIALPAEIVITILYWVLEFDGTLTYVSIMVHGGFAILLLIDGLLLSRIPLRMKQLFISQAFCLLYVVWGIIHAYTGIGNPYKEDGTQDDDAIYASIAWKENPTNTAIVVAGIFVLLNPTVFLVCRVLSRLFPRRLCGEEKERRFKGGKEPPQCNHDEEAATGYAKF